jgi:hypothetical protein
LIYRNTILGKKEVDNFALIAGRILVDECEYTLLYLLVYLSRPPLYTRVYRRHCSEAGQISI